MQSKDVYFENIQQNPNDYSSWENFITIAEQELDYDTLMQWYPKFLDQFPLLHVYWTKYADVTHKKTESPQKAIEVYQTAVSACPYVPDLWLAFVAFADSVAEDQEFSLVRDVFGRALCNVGTFSTSTPLWLQWAEFEKGWVHHQSNISSHFEDEDSTDAWLLSDPTFVHSSANVRAFAVLLVSLHFPLKDLSSVIEFSDQLLAELSMEDIQKGSLLAVSVAELLEVPVGVVEKLESFAKKARDHGVQDQIYEIFEDLHSDSLNKFRKLERFESSLHRNWWTLKDLDQKQLLGWRSYISFMIEDPDVSIDEKFHEFALGKLKWATDHFLKNSPDLALIYAKTLEHFEKNSQADECYQAVIRDFPDLKIPLSLVRYSFLARTNQSDWLPDYNSFLSQGGLPPICYIYKVRFVYTYLQDESQIEYEIFSLLSTRKNELDIYLEVYSMIKNHADVTKRDEMFRKFISILEKLMDELNTDFMNTYLNILVKDALFVVSPRVSLMFDTLKAKFSNFERR
ncbi:hypothetical protein GEMRC1_000048 [Eukaryota sp. GEM-RC1]